MHKIARLFLFLLVLLAGLTLPAAAQFSAAAEEPVEHSGFATLSVFDANILVFDPVIGSEGWILTVSGPENFDLRETFLAGEPIFLAVERQAGPLPDGVYTYELETLSPTSLQERVNDGSSGGTKLVQSGRFFISGGKIDLEGTTESSWEMAVGSSGFGGMEFVDTSTGKRVVRLADGASWNSIVVDSSGEVGLGTSAPAEALHVRRANGTARIYVTERSGITAQRNLLQLENNGGPLFVLKNSDTDATWFFSMNPNDDFQFSRSGTGGPEMLIRSDGQVQMGPGSDVAFNLFPNGNLTIGGVLTEASDREAKTDLEAVNAQDILNQVARLPLFRWRFKRDPEEVRHLGPAAQDFHGMFGLGRDDKHIATIDTSGVALAAIQGLYHRVQRQQAEIEVLYGLLELRDEYPNRATVDTQGVALAAVREFYELVQEQRAEIEELRAQVEGLQQRVRE